MPPAGRTRPEGGQAAPLKQAGSDVLVFLVVKPGRAKSALVGVRIGPGRAPGQLTSELEIALGAPPVDGAANVELLAFLTKVLALPKRRVTLDSGTTSRHKVVRVQDVQLGEVRAALEKAGCDLARC